MPVNRDKFESGDLASKPTVSERVQRLLESDSDKAYTVVELSQSLNVDSYAVELSLSELEKEGAVQEKQGYWIYDAA